MYEFTPLEEEPHKNCLTVKKKLKVKPIESLLISTEAISV